MFGGGQVNPHHRDPVTKGQFAGNLHQHYIADIEVFTLTTTFQIMQSLRLDRGPSGPIHP